MATRTTFTHALTIKEAAKALRLRWHVVRRLAVKGRIRAERVGGRWLIDGDDLTRVRRVRPWGKRATRRYAQNTRLYALGRQTRGRP